MTFHDPFPSLLNIARAVWTLTRSVVIAFLALAAVTVLTSLASALTDRRVALLTVAACAAKHALNTADMLPLSESRDAQQAVSVHFAAARVARDALQKAELRCER